MVEQGHSHDCEEVCPPCVRRTGAPTSSLLTTCSYFPWVYSVPLLGTSTVERLLIYLHSFFFNNQSIWWYELPFERGWGTTQMGYEAFLFYLFHTSCAVVVFLINFFIEVFMRIKKYTNSKCLAL